MFLQSPTSTGYFSNLTDSSVTNCRFSLIIGLSTYSSTLTDLEPWRSKLEKNSSDNYECIETDRVAGVSAM